MKKILLSTLALAFYAGASAQLKFTENFGGMTGTTLALQNSWSPNPVAGTDVGLVVQSNNTGALVYPGYTSGQNYITVARTDGRDPDRVFTSGGGAVSTAANSTFYISFLFRMSAGTTNISDNNAEYSITLHNTANTSYPCRFSARIDSDNNVEFGISKNTSGGDNGTTIQWTGNNYSRTATYLIVIRYDVVTGTTNDDMWLWVNPALGATPPTTASAALTITNNTDPAYGTQIDAIKIHQRSNTNSPIAAFDAFRVSNNTTSALAWADLTPVGTVLPATLGSIKAYEKQAGIQIDWTSLTEINLSHYDIERSADGRNFTAIGQVTADNTTSARNYGFFDANPLPGTSYYRLRNVDIDAKSEYSTVLRVSLDKSVKDVRLYPNPVTTGYVAFQSSDLAKGEYAAKIFNVSGQQVQLLKFTHTGGSINQTIQLPATIKSGMFTLVVEKSGEKVITKPFVVQ